jgi:hypothetical protein
MVLNAASRLLGGASFTTERSEAETKQAKGQAGVSFPLLSSLFKVAGEAGASSTVERREAREVTLGGIHMQVVDKLRSSGQIQSLILDDAQSIEEGAAQTYVEVRAVLMPLDYQAILRIVQTLAPLAAQVIQGFPQLQERLPKLKRPTSQKRLNERGNKQGARAPQEPPGDTYGWDSIAVELGKLADQLHEDMLASRQLDMVMVNRSDPSQMLGITTLNLGEYSATELQSRLAGADGIVIGKVARYYRSGENLPLLEKTVIAQALSMISRLVAIGEQGAEQQQQWTSQLSKMRIALERATPLSIPGPTVRVLAMSVCI